MSTRLQTERFDSLPQGGAQLGQFVIHTLRSGGEDSPRHEPVSLQSTQSERKHSLGNTADHPSDLIEPFGSIAEQNDDEHCPLVAHPRQDGAQGAAIYSRGVGKLDGHFDVLKYQVCAFLWAVAQVPILAQVAF